MSFQVGGIPVLQRSTLPPETPGTNYTGPESSTTLLPAGHQKSPEWRALPSPIIFEHNVPLILRDGCTIYADIFRPANSTTKIPALLAWGPFGKSSVGFFSLDLVPGRAGIPKSSISGYQNWEAPDPAEWVNRGYAIVNVDPRGVFDSEGSIRFFGSAEGKDGYDAVEEIAKLEWCDGGVAMVGNSWLAIAQWFIAAEKPPSLKAIAPFEGASDLYRETLCRGGVPFLPFWGFLVGHLCGRNGQEDMITMLGKHSHINEYWEDKRAKIEDIDIPAYILASYSTAIHTVGSFRGFEDMKHDKKWLRVHPTQEWHDLYQKETNDELQSFLDHYLKDLGNDWEKTPKVRVSMLNFDKKPVINHVFKDWPIPQTNFQKLYLNSNNQLSVTPSSVSEGQSYQADAPALQIDEDSEELLFSYTFKTKSHMVGYSKAVLYMSCPDYDNLDVFVQLRKASADGNLLQNLNIPLKDLGVSSPSEVVTVNSNKYLGPSGILRASRRAIDVKLSKTYWPVHSHAADAERRVPPGEVVRLEIGMWPTGIVFEEGEKLVFKIAGHHLVLAEFEPLRGQFVAENKGRHHVHFGGEFDSHVIVPFVVL